MTEKKREESDLGADAALYDAREKIILAMPLIIDAIIEKAQGGSYQHAKFLLEFAESERSVRPGSGDEESLAAMLMRELRDEPV